MSRKQKCIEFCFNEHAPLEEDWTADHPWFSHQLLVIDFSEWIASKGTRGFNVNLAMEPPQDLGILRLAYQLEIAPTSGRVHIQGYVMFKDTSITIRRDLAVQPRFTLFFGKPHWRECIGSTEDNLKYVSKEGPNGRITGTDKYCKQWTEMVTQRKRKREGVDKEKLHEECDAQINKWIDEYARKDASFYEMCEALLTVPDFEGEEKEKLKTIWRRAKNRLLVGKAWEKIYDIRVARFKDEQWKAGIVTVRQIFVQVYQGASGRGKSFASLFRHCPYGKPYVKNCSDKWWSGLTKSTKHIILDEFKGDGPTVQNPVFTVEFTLRVLDGLPLYLDPKMEKQVEAGYVLVTITTNLEFDRWFQSWTGVSAFHKEAIQSRIKKWEVFDGPNRRLAAPDQVIQEPKRSDNVQFNFESY